MKTLINNENKKIKVTAQTFEDVKHLYNEGFYFTHIKDINNKVHCIVIPDQNLN